MAILDAAGSDGSGEGVLGAVRLGCTADRRVLATVDSGGNVLLWETKSWTRLDTPESERTAIATQAAPESSGAEARSPDGRWVAVARRDPLYPCPSVGDDRAARDADRTGENVRHACAHARRAYGKVVPGFWQRLLR